MSSIFNSVLDILTIIVAIFSFVSISIVGIKYLTATSKATLKKTKKHFFEIIIGFTIYASLTAILHSLPL